MSYLLDTTVVAEVRRGQPDPGVMAWFDSVRADELYLSVAADGLMAATALVHGCTFVSRNTADVVQTGVRLVNPFEGNR